MPAALPRLRRNEGDAGGSERDPDGGGVEGPNPSSRRSPSPALARDIRLAGWAWIAFVAVSFVALVLIGRRYWFAGDEWQFFVNPHSVGDAFNPQNGHWSTTPIAVYQLLLLLFGLHTYLPYQGVLIAMHLGLATMIRTMMRRARVRPWTATVVAGAFVLFGPGDQNIFQGVQIGMVGTMVGAFAHMLLSDHDGPFDRRDALGIVCGAIGLMSSGMGPSLVATAALAILLRRGWLVAAFHTVPLGLMYLAWFVKYRSTMGIDSFGRPTPQVMLEFTASGERGVFLALSYFPVTAAILALVLVGGVGLLGSRVRWTTFRRRYALVAACLIGSFQLMALISLTRWFLGPEAAKSSRYVSMSAALILPAIAVAIDAIARRVRYSWWPAVALLLVAVPANASSLGKNDLADSFYTSQQELVAAVAESPLSRQVPSEVRFDHQVLSLGRVPTGFLVDAGARGLVPSVPVSEATRSQLPVRLGMQPGDAQVDLSRCTDVGAAIGGPLRAGDSIIIDARTAVADVVGGERGTPMRFDPANGAQLTVVLDGRTWDIRSDAPLKRCPAP